MRFVHHGSDVRVDWVETSDKVESAFTGPQILLLIYLPATIP